MIEEGKENPRRQNTNSGQILPVATRIFTAITSLPIPVDPFCSSIFHLFFLNICSDSLCELGISKGMDGFDFGVHHRPELNQFRA